MFSGVPSRVNEMRETLQQVKHGETDPDEVLERFNDVDGIERSISVAVAKREQDENIEDGFENSFDADFTLE